MHEYLLQDALKEDWFGKSIENPIYISLARDEHTLTFHAQRTALPTLHPKAKEGEFIAGLWEYDVAELFVSDPSTGQYLEFNLSPNGAFWGCAFDAPRMASKVQPDFQSLRSWSRLEKQAWEATLTIPLSFLPSLGDARFNITGVLLDEHQRFFTHAKLPGQQPDFHQPEHFVAFPVRKGA